MQNVFLYLYVQSHLDVQDLISERGGEVVAMADFMENEAVESDSDGSEDLARKKRPVGRLFD